MTTVSSKAVRNLDHFVEWNLWLFYRLGKRPLYPKLVVPEIQSEGGKLLTLLTQP
jgi:hypothetical protein